MKLMIPCLVCTQEAFESKDMNKMIKLRQINVEINDKGWYKVVCDEGHQFIAILQQMKFEILFDFGLMALDDGNYREAVLNFASSFERFLEFCIKVFIYYNKIVPACFDRTWEYIKNHSERQLGAFYFMFLNNLKIQPKKVSENWVSFRNKVIHQGYFPNKNETMEYGEYIMTYISDTIKKVRYRCEESERLVIAYDLMQKIESAGVNELPITTICPRSLISLLSKDEISDLNCALKIMKTNRLLQYTNAKEFFTYFKDIDKGLAT
ncbi:MAG TPA: hypothetical protein GX697_06620 [Firmicutes bacterium]|nr:hypothetical protein [Bacillota bacterium]